MYKSVCFFIFTLLMSGQLFAASLYEMAEAAEDRGDFKKAQELFDKACRGNDRDACLALAGLYFTGGDAGE